MPDENSAWEIAKKRSEIFKNNVWVKHYSEESEKIGLSGISCFTNWNDKALLSLWLAISCLDFRNYAIELQNLKLQKLLLEYEKQLLELQKALIEKKELDKINKTTLILRALKKNSNMLQKEIAKKLGVSESLITQTKKKYLQPKQPAQNTNQPSNVSQSPA